MSVASLSHPPAPVAALDVFGRGVTQRGRPKRATAIAPNAAVTAVLDHACWLVGMTRDWSMSTTPHTRYRSVTPRIFVDDVAGQVQFLREAFDATGEVEVGRPTEVHIGDSVVMVSSTDDRAVFLAFLYVYVDNADQTFQRAVKAGAEIMEAPLDTPYGDRRGIVRDPFGNIFQIAHPSSTGSERDHDNAADRREPAPSE